MADSAPTTSAPEARTGTELVADLELLVATQDPHIREHGAVQNMLDQRIRDLYAEQRDRQRQVSEMETAARRLGVEAVVATLAENRTQGIRVFSRVAHIAATAERLDGEQTEEVGIIMEGLGRARPGARMLLADRGSIIGARLVSRQIEANANSVWVRIVRTVGDEGTESFSYYPSDAKRGDSRRTLLAVGRQQVEEFVEQNWQKTTLSDAIDIAKAFAYLGIDLKEVIGDEEFKKLDTRLLEVFASYEHPHISYEAVLEAVASLNGRTPQQAALAVRRAIVTGLSRPMHQLMGANGIQARQAVAALLIHEGKLERQQYASMHPTVLAELANLEWRANKLAEIAQL